MQLVTYRPEGLSDTPLLFSKEARLLIGHPSSQTETFTLTMPPPVNRSKHASHSSCHKRRSLPEGLTRNQRYGLLLIELANSTSFRSRAKGTKPRRVYLDNFTGGLTVGIHANLNVSGTFKYKEGITNKERIVGQMKQGGICMSFLDLLSLEVGLMISVCSWNAERVTLWQALRLAFVQSGEHRITSAADRLDRCSSLGHQLGDPRCIMECFNIPLNEDILERWKGRLASTSRRDQCLSDAGPPQRNHEQDREELWELCRRKSFQNLWLL